MAQQTSNKKKPRAGVIRWALVFAVGTGAAGCLSGADLIVQRQIELDRLQLQTIRLEMEMQQYTSAERLQWQIAPSMKEIMQDRDLICALGEYYEIIQKKLKRKIVPEKFKRYFDLKEKGECISSSILNVEPLLSVKVLKNIIAPAPNRTEIATLDQKHLKKRKSKKLDSTKQAAEILEELFKGDDSSSKKDANRQTTEGRVLNPM